MEGREKTYRTFWPRFWAGFVDALIFLPLWPVDSWIFDNVHSRAVLAPWLIFYSLAGGVYSVLLHGYFGQTIGKRVAGVKVLDISGSKLSMRQAVLRDSIWVAYTVYLMGVNLQVIMAGGNPYAARQRLSELTASDWLILYAVAFSFLWFLLELVTMLMNRKRRALHDFIAGSVVVRTERAAQDA